MVRINDRGPFVGDRIIDLSYTAAAKLDMLREGTALVEVRVITPPGQSELLTTTTRRSMTPALDCRCRRGPLPPTAQSAMSTRRRR